MFGLGYLGAGKGRACLEGRKRVNLGLQFLAPGVSGRRQ